jgi:two-component system LytT family response regulator
MTEPLRALIVDDEPLARAGLRHALREVDWLQVCGEAADGPAALAAVAAHQPDLLLLDIELPGFSGLELLRRLDPAPPCVIFTTAYAEHAVSAFELGALDYLLKPFGPPRLHAALERVRAALGEPAPPALERLAEAWGQGPIRRLFVRQGRSILPLAVDSIRRFEAVGDYVAAHAPDQAHWLHLSLNRLEQRLDPQAFVRIHRAHLVNLAQVLDFQRQLDGSLRARLRSGEELPVSRSRAQVIRELAR